MLAISSRASQQRRRFELDQLCVNASPRFAGVESDEERAMGGGKVKKENAG